LVDDVVRLGVVGDDGLFLVLLGLDGFLGLGGGSLAVVLRLAA
jgi:hypothetical protein